MFFWIPFRSSIVIKIPDVFVVSLFLFVLIYINFLQYSGLFTLLHENTLHKICSIYKTNLNLEQCDDNCLMYIQQKSEYFNEYAVRWDKCKTIHHKSGSNFGAATFKSQPQARKYSWWKFETVVFRSSTHSCNQNEPLFHNLDSFHISKCIRNNWANQRNANQTITLPTFENFSGSKLSVARFSFLKQIQNCLDFYHWICIQVKFKIVEAH